MKNPIGIAASTVLLFIASSGFGQVAGPVTINVGDPPLVMGGVDTDLEPITITENFPDALQDGYFYIAYENWDVFEIDFTGSSTATGSVTASPPHFLNNSDYSFLVVQVDVDDSSIDTITVQPNIHWNATREITTYEFKNLPLNFTISDETQAATSGVIPEGQAAGIGSANVTLGNFGGYGGISIGTSSSITLEVGETVNLGVASSHPSDIIIESFDPSVASVDSYSLDEVMITGNSRGEALIQAWDPWASSAHLTVTVLEPQPQPEPEPERPQPTVTITEDAPGTLIMNEQPTTFGSITITENYETALRDGYFLVYYNGGPDNHVEFTPQSTAGGSVGETPVPTVYNAGFVSALLIQVDADDNQLDSITVTPHGTLASDGSGNPGGGIHFYVSDQPTAWALIPNGQSAGLDSSAAYTFGEFGGNGGITIDGGSALHLEVGETVTLSLNYDEGINIPPANDVDSLDSTIVSVDSYTLGEVTLSGVSPGEAIVRAWDVQNNSGYLTVNVSEASGGDGEGSPGDDPGKPGRGDNPPGRGDDPPGHGDVPPGRSDDPPSRGDNPPSRAGGLPRMESRAVLGGGDTTAALAAGARAEGEGVFRTQFNRGERVAIEGEIIPENSHVSQPGDLFIVAKVSTPSGFGAWFYKNRDGNFLPWNGHLRSLQPAHELETLAASEWLEVFEGELLPGEYRLYLGYMAEGGTLIYSDQPLLIEVQANE